jgi:glucuronokinase
MLLIRKHAHARAGLVGNPSDGYHGKTISLIVRNYSAQVVLYEWDRIEIVWTEQDKSAFDSIHDLLRDVKLHGYYGGVRLIKATIKKFCEYCKRAGKPLHAGKFSIRYQSDVPRQVGLAGSSAIIVATLRCLMDFYHADIPLQMLPSLALSVETEELSITGGLQDRVIQFYEGLVYMDFAPERMIEIDGHLCGHYERLDPALLPPIYLAYGVAGSEPTEIFHNDIRGRFNRGDPVVVKAMGKFASLAAQARDALIRQDHELFGNLMNENFDTRRTIYKLPDFQVKMVEVARSTGASAKFAGSGGAIVGVYRDEAMYRNLVDRLQELGCVVFKPMIE